MGFNTMTLEDLWLCILRKDGEKVKLLDLVPFVLVPGLLKIAYVSPICIAIVLSIFAVGVIVSYVMFQQCRSQFFYAWTVASALYLFFEFHINYRLLYMAYKENLVGLALVACSYRCFFMTRLIAETVVSDIQITNKMSVVKFTYCQICQRSVTDRYFHSIWLDCCISRSNYVYFCLGRLFGSLALLLAIDIGLTNVCHSFLTFGGIMLPDDCTFACSKPLFVKIFALSLYAIGFTCVILLPLMFEMLVCLASCCFKIVDEPASSGDSGDESGSDPESPGEKVSQANLRQDWTCNSNTERDAGSSREPQASTSSTTQEADSSKASQSSMPKILPKIDLPGGAMLYHPGVLAGLDGLGSNLGLGNLAMRYPHSFILGLANQGQEAASSSTQPQFITIPLSMAMGNQPANGCPSASSDDSSELQDLSTGGRK